MISKKTYWIGGRHSVMSAIANPKRIIKKIITSDSELAEKLKNNKNFKTELINKNKIDNIFKNYDFSHQNIAAEIEKLENLELKNELKKDQNYILIDGITDPRNIGSIIRTAAVFNINGIVVKKNSFDQLSPLFYKTSSGAIEIIKILSVSNLNMAIELLKKNNFWIYGFAENAKKEINDENFSKKNVFVFGSEEKGISKLVMQNCDQLLKFKTNQKFSTLNVANAVTAALSIFQMKSS